jgi:hypothetical protein
MAMIFKRASTSRPSGEWSDDDYDVLADGIFIGRIMKAAAAPVGIVPQPAIFAPASITIPSAASPGWRFGGPLAVWPSGGTETDTEK